MTYTAAALACALIAIGLRHSGTPNSEPADRSVDCRRACSCMGSWADGDRLGSAALAGLIGGLIFALFYRAGGMGAGDVKLMIAVGCLMGLAPLRVMLLATSLSGAAFGLAIAISRGQLRQTLTNVASIMAHHGREGLTPHPELSLAISQTLRLPFALPIAVGCIAAAVGKLHHEEASPGECTVTRAADLKRLHLCVEPQANRDTRRQLWVPNNHYVAPSRPLQAGEALKAEDMELVSLASRSNPLRGAVDASRRYWLAGLSYIRWRRVSRSSSAKLAAPGSVAGLSSKIPDGQRAIALKSDEVVGVGGFLIPGSRVDVLVSYRTDQLPEPITATVVQDAVVLAAGQQMEPDPAGKPTAVTVVTLLLTPQESERAFLASNQGVIHFVLRNRGDRGRGRSSNQVFLSQLSSGSVRQSRKIVRSFRRVWKIGRPTRFPSATRYERWRSRRSWETASRHPGRTEGTSVRCSISPTRPMGCLPLG